jgi:hypothetical protein
MVPKVLPRKHASSRTAALAANGPAIGPTYAGCSVRPAISATSTSTSVSS